MVSQVLYLFSVQKTFSHCAILRDIVMKHKMKFNFSDNTNFTTVVFSFPWIEIYYNMLEFSDNSSILSLMVRYDNDFNIWNDLLPVIG